VRSKESVDDDVVLGYEPVGESPAAYLGGESVSSRDVHGRLSGRDTGAVAVHVRPDLYGFGPTMSLDDVGAFAGSLRARVTEAAAVRAL